MSQPINPYAAPQFAEQQLQPAPFSPRSYAEPYRSARGKAKVVLFLTGLAIVLQVLLVGSFFMQISMLNEALTGGGVEMEVAQANDQRQMGLSVLLIIFAISAFIMLLVWVYAAHRNLPALQGNEGEFTPGWAVGWFFVPIMNLFKPYQAMRHLWNESDPRRLMPPGPGIVPALGGALVGWWWGLRIVSVIGERIFSASASGDNDIVSLINISWVAMALIVALDIPMLVCQFGMVRKIQQFQDERNLLVEQSRELAPSSGVNPFAVLG